MTKMLMLAVLAMLSVSAAPVVGLQFGSNSGTFGNLQVKVTGLAPSEVLTFREDWAIFVDYPDGYLPDGSATYAQVQQTVSNGSYNLGVYGQATIMIGNGQTYSENLQYLHVTVTSNLRGFVQTFYIDPQPGSTYVALGPVRNVSPSEVPEPATYGVVGAGLVAVALWKRGRRAEPPKEGVANGATTEPVTNPYKLEAK